MLFFSARPSAKVSFNEPQRGRCSLYPSWPLRSFFSPPLWIRNKYYVGDPCQLCRTTSESLSFLLPLSQRKVTMREHKVRSEFHRHPPPPPSRLPSSPPTFRTLCAVECSKIRDCVILLMPTVIVDVAANIPSDDE